MIRLYAQILSVCLALCCPVFLTGQTYCPGTFTEYFLNSNTIRASFFPRGNKFTTGNEPGFLVPYPSSQRLSSIFASSPWLGGFDDAGNLKLAVEKFASNQLYDFSVGPLNSIGLPFDSICEHFDQAWSVYYEDILRHKTDYETDFKIDDTIAAVFGWPARGNKFFESMYGFELPFDNQGLAPFRDYNGNHIYDPENGDYPVVRRSIGGPEYIPDQILWMVFNDTDDGDSIGPGPLRFEIQLTAYAFHCADKPILNNTIFNSYKILNRSVSPLDSVLFGIWTDYDLGCSVDDCIGSDSTRSSEFVYNADPIDGDSDFDCSTGADTYAARPPVQSMTYLSHAMHSFISSLDFQDTPIEYYRQLNGYFRDGTPITPEGDGYNPGSGLPKTKFLFSGDPRDTSAWTCINNFPEGAEQRTVSSVSLGRMDPGATRIVEMAYMFHYDTAVGHLDQITGMYKNIDSLFSFLGDPSFPCIPFPACVDDDCVWPGDFDHNGIADQRDYLPWAVFNGTEGPERNGLISWRGHFGEDWNYDLDGINAKHADGDGNGTIDERDVELNFTHRFLTTSDYTGDVTYTAGDDLVMSAMPINDQGRIRNFTVHAGHDLEDVLGITFEVEFDTAIFTKSFPLTFWPEDSARLIFWTPHDPGAFIPYSAVQTDHQTIDIESGFNFVRSLTNSFTIREGLPIPDSTIIRLRNIKGIDAEGNDLHLGSFPLVVYKEGFTGSSNPVAAQEVTIVPNPTSGQMHIYTDTLQDAILFSALGQPVLFLSINSTDQPIDISRLPSGIYFLRVGPEGHMTKIIKM